MQKSNILLVSEESLQEKLINAKPVLTIDTQGLCCPYPSFETVKHMNKLKEGEVLEVITDSEESAKDSIPNVCNRRNWHYIVIQEGNKWRLKIIK
jgi:TusA-related sulfurtransferase